MTMGPLKPEYQEKLDRYDDEEEMANDLAVNYEDMYEEDD
jgi:hypothetical protein